MDIRARFERFVARQPAGCWLWTGHLNRDGYGRFSVGGRKQQCHRVAYELFVGPIPDGMQIDHVRARGCISKACVNPAHLEAVTQVENPARGDGAPAQNARRTQCRKGHELSGDNLKIGTDGHRRCRICLREKHRRQEARRCTT